jgi:hypothetical protein
MDLACPPVLRRKHLAAPTVISILRSVISAAREALCASRVAFVTAAWGWLALAEPCGAQTHPPEGDLRQLRAQFRESLLTALLPEQHAYHDQLLELEKKLVTAHDYAGAIQSRDERIALEQEITAYEQELPRLAARASGADQLLPERIVFKPSDARLSGLTLEKDGTLAQWSGSQASATWSLPKLPAGGYEVFLKYSSGKEDITGFIVKENFYFLRGKTTPSNEKPAEKSLGTLRIRDGEGTLTLAAESAPKNCALRLLALELAPVNR